MGDAIFFDEENSVKIVASEICSSSTEFTKECHQFTDKTEQFIGNSKLILNHLTTLTKRVDAARAEAMGYRMKVEQLERGRAETIADLKRQVAIRNRTLELLEKELESLRYKEGMGGI
eukprot:gnl/Chilomastix_cuspidata/3932.p1 GENE.gnl/Chilomastix_cuspidata/3932~~gnl/Chilomastix_cuspidata/3932.p1  ORF type:complete len:118 (+),score=7.43 gnl/Chilomastix_cuspidata/3932:76-429(+)